MSERGNYNAVPPPSNLSTGNDSQLNSSSSKSTSIDFESAVAKAKALAARLKEQHGDSDDQSNRKRGLTDINSQNGFSTAGNGTTVDVNGNYRGYERDPKRPYPNNEDDDNIDIIAKLTGSSSIYGNNPHFGVNNTSEEFNVPSNMVGLIIGKNGENLKRIQGLHGVKITFATENTAGDTERRTTAVGSKEGIKQAREMIEQLCQSGAFPRSFLPGMGAGQDDSSSLVGVPRLVSPGILRVQIPISGTKVGLVIGRGGETIRDLCTQSGARINVVQDNSIPHGADVERLINIQGTEDSIERAKALIQAIVNGEFSTNRNSANYGLPISSNSLTVTYGPPPLGQERISIPIPSDKIPALSSSDTLKTLQQQSRTRITLEPNEENPPPATRVLHITGFRDAIDYCRTLLLEKFDSMGIPIDSNVYGSSGYGGYNMGMSGAMGYGYPMGYPANAYGSYMYPGYQQGYPSAYNGYPATAYPTADGQQQVAYSAQAAPQEPVPANTQTSTDAQTAAPEAYPSNPQSIEEMIQTAATSAAAAAMAQHASSFQNNPEGYNAYYKQLMDYYTDHYTNYYNNPSNQVGAANPSTEQTQDQSAAYNQNHGAHTNYSTTNAGQDNAEFAQSSAYYNNPYDSAPVKDENAPNQQNVSNNDDTEVTQSISHHNNQYDSALAIVEAAADQQEIPDNNVIPQEPETHAAAEEQTTSTKDVLPATVNSPEPTIQIETAETKAETDANSIALTEPTEQNILNDNEENPAAQD